MILCTVHKCECKEVHDRHAIVEGQKAFFAKHDSGSCCMENISHFHTSVRKNKQCIIVKMSLKGLLPDIRHIADNDIIFQQDGVPAHC